jgi:hypothetical protein
VEALKGALHELRWLLRLSRCRKCLVALCSGGHAFAAVRADSLAQSRDALVFSRG